LMLAVYNKKCMLGSYVINTLKQPRMIAYDMSLTKIIRGFYDRVSPHLKETRMSTLRSHLEKVVWMMIAIHYVTWLLSRSYDYNLSIAKMQLMNRVLIGKEDDLMVFYREIAVIVWRDPSVTIHEMALIRSVVNEIVLLILKQITSYEHAKLEVVLQVFARVTSPP
jgi:hypothetical protein